MKKIISACCMLMSLSFAAFSQSGKDYSNVVNNHSISVTTLGAEYGYEQRLGDKWSLIGRAGLVTTGLQLSNFPGNFEAYFSMAYGITVEPRCYTSFTRRLAAGKSTVNNSSDFVAIRMQAMSDGENGALALTPMYGIRRNGGKHWFHEFTFGARLAETDMEFEINPHLQYRLGFVF